MKLMINMWKKNQKSSPPYLLNYIVFDTWS